jgi:hypothetical protein
MDEWLPVIVAGLLPIVAVIGGISIAIAAIISKNRVRELRIRERIAMIEKGMVPPPEIDPAGFDRAMIRHDRDEWYGRRAAGRHRRAGIILIGVGLGLMALRLGNGFAMREGVGAGGFLAILGLAFVISSLFDYSHERAGTSSSRTPPTPPSPE